MVEGQKSLKEYCKEAKKRMKSGFWQTYKKDLEKYLCLKGIKYKKSECNIFPGSAEGERTYYL